MSEPDTTESAALAPRHSSQTNMRAVIAVSLVIVLGVVGLVYSQVQSRNETHREVTAAQIVSHKVIDAIQNRDGAAARALGSKQFQKSYTSKQLTDQFKAIEVATSQPPKLVEHFGKSTNGKHTIYFVYAYTRLKIAYYVRTSMVDESNNWRVSNITGNVNRSTLAI